MTDSWEACHSYIKLKQLPRPSHPSHPTSADAGISADISVVWFSGESTTAGCSHQHHAEVTVSADQWSSMHRDDLMLSYCCIGCWLSRGSSTFKSCTPQHPYTLAATYRPATAFRVYCRQALLCFFQPFNKTDFANCGFRHLLPCMLIGTTMC